MRTSTRMTPLAPLIGPQPTTDATKVAENNGDCDSIAGIVVIQLPIDDLHSHPLQASGEFYEAPSTADFDRLFDDIIENGLRDAIHVLPPGNRAGLPAHTILDGHTRVAIYRRKLELDGDFDEEMKAKFSTIPAVVRYDLIDKTAEEIELVYLGCNDNRRQIHMLDRARIARRIYELERGKRRPDAAETRDVIGQRLGVSGVTLSRWMRAIDAPAIVRDLLKRGVIPLMAAARIGLLPEMERAKVAAELSGPAARAMSATSRRERIGARKAVLGVVDRYVDRPGARHVTDDGAVRSLVGALQRGLEDLGERVGTVQVFADDLLVLQAAEVLLAALKTRVMMSGNPITVIDGRASVPKSKTCVG